MPAAVRLNDVRVVPAGVDDPQFPVLFARNGERNLIGDENRGDRALLSPGGRALKSNNGRLYKSLEADAEVGGQEWRARIDSLVEKIGRDLVPMARLIGRKPKDGGGA